MKSTAEFKFLILVFFWGFINTSATASFDPLPVGGRAAGMGEAYTAIVDDVYSVYYNPAGILQLERPEVGSYFSKLFSGLSDNSQISRMFVAYGQPLKNVSTRQAFGVNYLALGLGGLYKEETFGLTYGREFQRFWNVGGNLKFLRKSIGTDEYTSNAINPMNGQPANGPDPLLSKSRASSAIGIDLGVQYHLSQVYALGGSVRNLNEPDLALGSQKDVAPRVYNLALARHLRNGSLDAELMNWKSIGTNTRFSIGGEFWLKSGFGLRAGGGVGSRNYSSLSFGASYRFDSFQLDYASVLPLQGIQGTLGMQQVSLTVRFGKPPVDPMEAQLLKEKERRIKAETEAQLAQAERDRLKKQIIELTQEKAKATAKQSTTLPEKAMMEMRPEPAPKRGSRTTPEQDARVLAEYNAALSDYTNQVQNGLGLKEKRALLEGIQARFADTKVNLATIKRELKNLNLEESRTRKDFELSMNFYQRLVQQGANNDERRSMLQRIIQKYKDSGVDIKIAEEEIKKLK